MAAKDNWTTEDYAEYQRQLDLINDSYGNSIPQETKERFAAEIVNKKYKQ